MHAPLDPSSTPPSLSGKQMPDAGDPITDFGLAGIRTLVELSPETRLSLVQFYSGRTNNVGYGSRSSGLKEYEEEASFLPALPVSERITELHEKLGRPVRVLDIGCGEGRALEDLRVKFGEKVELWGTTLGSTNVDPAIRILRLPSELLPVECRGYFDLVVSRASFEMHHSPHLSLRAVSLALKGGGEAWITGSRRHCEEDEAAGKEPEELTSSGLEVLRESISLWSTRGERSVEEKVEIFLDIYGKLPGFPTLVVPWLNTIAGLRERNFEVDFLRTDPLPSYLKLKAPSDVE